MTPEIIFEGGDPSQLPVGVRRHILQEICRQMAKGVAVSFSIVYSSFVLIVFIALMTFTNSYTDIVTQYQSMHPGGWAYPDEPRRILLALLATVPLVIGWVGSLYYLHFVVRTNENDI